MPVYHAGQLIFMQGSQSDVAYVIESGRVEIFTQTAQGEENRLAILQAGHMFGEMGPMDKAPRSASARALTEVVLREVEIEEE